MMMAVDENSIIHYKLINETINNKMFKDFFEEILLKFGKDNISNYILIMDNAKTHIAKKIKKYAIKNKLKILTNIPHYSIFNGIEYVFFFA
jgi:transposase